MTALKIPPPPPPPRIWQEKGKAVAWQTGWIEGYENCALSRVVSKEEIKAALLEVWSKRFEAVVGRPLTNPMPDSIMDEETEAVHALILS